MKHFLLLFASLILIQIVFSTSPIPEIDNFVIDSNSGTCGIYRTQGEEIPSNWKVFEPIRYMELNMSLGYCNFKYDSMLDTQSQEEYYNNCCTSLGFEYQDPYANPLNYSDKIINFIVDGENREWKCSPTLAKEVYSNQTNKVQRFEGVLINHQTNQCRPLQAFDLYGVDRGIMTPSNEQCYITDNNWESYEYEFENNFYQFKISTPYGDCTFENNISTCCSILGFEDVGVINLNKKIQNNSENSSSNIFTKIMNFFSSLF